MNNLHKFFNEGNGKCDINIWLMTGFSSKIGTIAMAAVQVLSSSAIPISVFSLMPS